MTRIIAEVAQLALWGKGQKYALRPRTLCARVVWTPLHIASVTIKALVTLALIVHQARVSWLVALYHRILNAVSVSMVALTVQHRQTVVPVVLAQHVLRGRAPHQYVLRLQILFAPVAQVARSMMSMTNLRASIVVLVQQETGFHKHAQVLKILNALVA
jgi:hypothetical protein